MMLLACNASDSCFGEDSGPPLIIFNARVMALPIVFAKELYTDAAFTQKAMTGKATDRTLDAEVHLSTCMPISDALSSATPLSERHNSWIRAGVEMEDALPENEYKEYFAPDYRLHIETQSNRENLNTNEYLEKVKQRLMENLSRYVTVDALPGLVFDQKPAGSS